MSSFKREIFFKTDFLGNTGQKCTYIVISSLNYFEMRDIYNFKSCHRNMKTMYSMDAITISDLGIKNVIKLLTEWALDGIIINNINQDTVECVCKFFKALDKLPSPYDFQWKKCINLFNVSLDSQNIIELVKDCTTVISPITKIKQLTDSGILPDSIILNVEDLNEADRCVELVKFIKLGGIMIHNEDGCSLAFNSFEHTLHIQQNHLDYPTSNIVRQIANEKRQQLDDIIDSYFLPNSNIYNISDGVLKISVDIDFI